MKRLIRLAAAVLLLAFAGCSAGGEAANLAQGTTGFVSSNASGGVGAALTDALSDCDGSTYAVCASGDKQPWFEVDLGKEKKVNRVKLYFGSNEGDYICSQPGAYELQVSLDGVNYTTVCSVEHGSYGKTELCFDTVKARYVRVQVTERWPASDYVALREMYVYNSGEPDLAVTENTEKVRVLFIGNSLTVYHDVAESVQHMFELVGVRAEVDVSLVLGTTLIQHAGRAENKEIIDNGEYDYIVLQDKASGYTHDVLQTGTFLFYNKFLTDCDAQLIMYMIWANESVIDSQDEVTQGYVEAAENIGARVAPAGVVWKQFYDEGTSWYSDNIHGNATGSYMAAACIFYTITGRTEPISVAEGDETLSRFDIPLETAVSIHERACATAVEYNK